MSGSRLPTASLHGVVMLSAVLVAWLFMTAMPALADGGPHVMSTNNGSGTAGLTADSCAGCHRVHSSQSPTGYLLTSPAATVSDFCLSCHGSSGAGATTDVTLGIQFRSANAPSGTPQDPTDVTAVAGALRGGGFLSARIGSGSAADAAFRPSRISYPKWNGVESRLETWFSELVPVLGAGQPATSAHLALDGAPNVVPTNTAWGNGPLGSSTTGPIVALECTSCHNPHGNGKYRILKPVPAPAVVSGTFSPAGAVSVTDAAGLPAGDTRNYTVIDAPDLASVGSDPTEGDYWRLYRPWDAVPTYDPGNPDADGHGVVPALGDFGDQPAGTVGASWRGQITAWCAACHTRYAAPRSAAANPSGDAVYAYRHQTNQTECTQCHVSHGSNAVMSGTYSSTFPYPAEPNGSALSGPSSRLLKLDNRGTCQACHDPTGTVPFTGVIENP